MKIALVGVDKRIIEILKLTKLMSLPIEIKPYPYGHYTHLSRIIKTIKGVDGILFAGTLPYFLTLNEIDTSVPTAFLEFDETGVMKLIFASELHQAPRAISVDSVQSSVIKHIYRELGLSLPEVSAIEGSNSSAIEDILDFHITNYKKNNDTQLITGFFSVHKYLLNKSLPCTLIEHTYFSVLKGINKISDAVNFKNSSGNHPAVVIIKIDRSDKLQKLGKDDYRYQRFLYKYFDYMLDFQKQLQSFVFNKGAENYYLISTRNLIEQYTNGYRDFPLLYDVFIKFNFTISVGIGYGINAISAFTNGTEALGIAVQTGNTVKVLTGSGQIISPVSKRWGNYSIRNFDDKIVRIAEKSNITAENISKIISIIDHHGSNYFTAYDLSKALGITPRSGSRLIAKFHSAGYARESGVEQPAKGRPRRVFEFNL